MSNVTMGLFQSSLMLYIPLSIAATFGILFIPSLLVSGAKPEAVARAISCYMLKTFGVVLLALSSVQLTYALMMLQLPESHTLSALLLIFALGLGILVHQSKKVASIDEASSMVPRLVFSHTCEIVGGLIALIAAISIVVTFMMTEGFSGWKMSATMLILGTTLMYLSSAYIGKRNKKVTRTSKNKKK